MTALQKKTAKTTSYVVMKTPLGLVTLTSDGKAITGIYTRLEKMEKQHPHRVQSENAILRKARRQLEEYFSGHRSRFSIPLKAEGTPFQKKVWKALSEIPFGETVSYAFIAKTIGNPKASRAVGMANNKNPIGIIVPCHRVVGADGSLTGYAGGLGRKQWLLRHEKKNRYT